MTNIRVMIELDGQRMSAKAGTSILDAAKAAGLFIPTLCHLPGRACKPVCRLCSVAIAGWKGLHPACATPLQEGMSITAQSPQLERMRLTLMSLVLEEHSPCTIPDCHIEQLAQRLGIPVGAHSLPAQEALGKAHPSVASDYILFDSSQCIHCDRCIRACERAILTRSGRGPGVSMVFGHNQPIGTSGCIACGDCLAVCPSGALAKHNK